MKTLLILSALLSCITTHVIAQVKVPSDVGKPKPHPEMRNNYLSYLFKGKQFDIYDQQSRLLYSNVQMSKDGKLSGLPGLTEWTVFTGNVLQLTADTDGNVASYAIAFDGEQVALKPIQAKGILNQPLVLKEKQ